MKKVRQFIDTSGKLSQEGFLKKLGDSQNLSHLP